MLPDDRDDFLRFVRKDDLVAVVADGSDSPIVRPIEHSDFHAHKNLYLWNRRFLPSFKLKWIPGPQYYGVNVLDLPLLQLSGSALTTWEEKPALVQGRLYGIFDPDLEKPPEFEKWYEHLARWIARVTRRIQPAWPDTLRHRPSNYLNRAGICFPNSCPLRPRFG